MSKIYADYDDKFVKNTIIYTATQEMYANGVKGMVAYKDKECTEGYTNEELLDVYLKGAILCVNEEQAETYLSVTYCSIFAGVGMAIALWPDGSKATILSKEVLAEQ